MVDCVRQERMRFTYLFEGSVEPLVGFVKSRVETEKFAH